VTQTDVVRLLRGFYREQRTLVLTTAALIVGFLFVLAQVAWGGPLRDLDDSLSGGNWYERHPLALQSAGYIDHLGLRGVTATILLIIAALIWRLHRQWRPIVLAAVALLSLNLVVGALKIMVGRTKPRLGLDVIDAGGMSFPSGHSANAVLTWGLIAYLLIQYSRRARARTGRLIVSVVSITFAVCAVSLFRNTHWLTDLVGGVLIGAALLTSLMAVDRHRYLLAEQPAMENRR
jgi:membrane-associated phospholipid phosphatase